MTLFVSRQWSYDFLFFLQVLSVVEICNDGPSAECLLLVKSLFYFRQPPLSRRYCRPTYTGRWGMQITVVYHLPYHLFRFPLTSSVETESREPSFWTQSTNRLQRQIEKSLQIIDMCLGVSMTGQFNYVILLFSVVRVLFSLVSLRHYMVIPLLVKMQKFLRRLVNKSIVEIVPQQSYISQMV